jgi:hypothetical protein
MKNKCLFLLFAAASFAATTGHSNAQVPGTAVARFNAINRELPKCQIKKVFIEGYSTEGGQLTRYSKNGQVQKLVARHFGESGRATEEYYFWKVSLFFVLRTDWDYQIMVGQPGAPGKETRRQERFYFQDGKLTRWMSDGNKVNDLTTPAALQVQGDYHQFAREFLAKVKGK